MGRSYTSKGIKFVYTSLCSCFDKRKYPFSVEIIHDVERLSGDMFDIKLPTEAFDARGSDSLCCLKIEYCTVNIKRFVGVISLDIKLYCTYLKNENWNKRLLESTKRFFFMALFLLQFNFKQIFQPPGRRQNKSFQAGTQNVPLEK